MWLMKMSYRWFLFQCQPPVPRGFLFIYDYEFQAFTAGLAVQLPALLRIKYL